MNRQQRAQKKEQRRKVRKDGRKPVAAGPNPAQEALARVPALEENLGVIFQNQMQVKRGLDAAELNQRAAVKVVQQLAQALQKVWGTDNGDFPVAMLDGAVDWGVYYRLAEDDVKAEQLVLYKQGVQLRMEKVEKIEKDLEMFEQETRAVMAKDPQAGPGSQREAAVERYLIMLKKEIMKVKTAAEACSKDEPFQPMQFNDKVLDDTIFMLAQREAKKAAEAASEQDHTLVHPTEETVTEFGG